MSKYEKFCSSCDGSGEGYGSDTRCYYCKGKGVVKVPSDYYDRDDSDDKYQESKDRKAEQRWEDEHLIEEY